ncbi:MAG: hypothetical protein WCN88_04915 [Candidatus Falkowbacteria bacterium]
MKTSVDILTGLIAVKELEIRTLKDRIAFLQGSIQLLQQENDQLYAVLAQEKKVDTTDHTVGFKKTGGK